MKSKLDLRTGIKRETWNRDKRKKGRHSKQIESFWADLKTGACGHTAKNKMNQAQRDTGHHYTNELKSARVRTFSLTRKKERKGERVRAPGKAIYCPFKQIKYGHLFLGYNIALLAIIKFNNFFLPVHQWSVSRCFAREQGKKNFHHYPLDDTLLC